MKKVKVGLLPCYLKLYDDAVPEARPQAEAFAGRIAAELECRHLEVIAAPVCRLQDEFGAAIAALQRAARSAGLSREDIGDIFYGNAARLQGMLCR